MTVEATEMRGSRLLNVTVGAVRLAVNILVSAAVASILVRSLGLDQYGTLAGLLAIAAAATSISNAFINANALYLTQGHAVGNEREASEVASAVLASIVALAAMAALVALAFDVVSGGELSGGELGLLSVLLIGTGATAAAGALSAPHFVYERFASRDAIDATVRLGYLGAIALLVPIAGFWAVALAILGAGLLRMALFAYTSRRLMPTLRVSVSLMTQSAVRRTFALVGWLSVDYFSAAATIAILLAVVRLTFDELLGEAAVLTLGLSLMLQVLTLFGLVVSPAILRAWATGRSAGADAAVHEFVLLSALASTGLGVIAMVAGPDFLELWLGVGLGEHDELVLGAVVLVGFATTLRVPMSVYCIGAGRARMYALLTLSEGVIVVVAISALLFTITAASPEVVFAALLGSLGGAAMLKYFLVIPRAMNMGSLPAAYLMRILAAVAVGACAVWINDQGYLAPWIAVCIGVLPAAALLLRTLAKRDKQQALEEPVR